jgi:hypothetical protein
VFSFSTLSEVWARAKAAELTAFWQHSGSGLAAFWHLIGIKLAADWQQMATSWQRIGSGLGNKWQQGEERQAASFGMARPFARGESPADDRVA